MKKTLLRWMYAILWPMVLFVALESIVRASPIEAANWVLRTPFAALLFNYLCYFALINLFQFIKRKGLFYFTQVTVSTLILVFAGVSYYKMLLRMEPVLPSDIALIGAGLSMAASYVPHFYLIIWTTLALFVTAMVFVLVRFSKDKRGKPLRIVSLAAFLLCGLAVFYVNSGQDMFLRAAALKNYTLRYSLVGNAKFNGTAFQLTEYIAEHHTSVTPPAGYSRDAVEALLQEDAGAPPEILPNIIFILGESMADITQLEGLVLKEDPMPNIRRMMAQYPSGYLTVHTYGGGTLMAEGAVLTGMSADAYIPHRFDSIAWRLKPFGYRATALHTYWGWFYDRNKQMKDLGFDQFIPLEAMTGNTTFAYYPEDELLYNQALGVLKASEGRDLIYMATMQTHGGYGHERTYDAPINETVLPQDVERELNNFFVLQKKADQAVSDFINNVAQSDEPTVVVYFGDHFPGITLTLEELGYDLGNPDLYQMPYFVWSNYDIPFQGGDLVDKDLSGNVLDAFGLPETLYQRYEDQPEAYKLVTYDALYGRNYAWDTVGLSEPGMGYQLGRSPRIDSAVLTQDNWLVLRGEDITWRIEIDYGGARWQTVFNTDGKTAYAKVDDDKAIALRKGGKGKLYFVDDLLDPFATVALEGITLLQEGLEKLVGE